MDITKLFAGHIHHLRDTYDRALAELKDQAHAIDAVLIHSGTEGMYFADDHHIPFQPFGHFSHWLPVRRPDQMVLVQPGHKPVYFEVVPPDFWYDQTVEREDWWADAFNIVSLSTPEEVFDHLPATRRIAFLGGNTGFAADLGLPAYLLNDRHLTNYLDYHRGMKTPYEVHCIREANRRAMVSHDAAQRTFEDGGSEWDIHAAYLNANHMLEWDTPYTNIVAMDEKSAILHYQYKRKSRGAGQALLIDAGFRHQGYCADITRTYFRNGVHPVFRSLVEGVTGLQLALVEEVRVGKPYAEIHDMAHAHILDLLLEHGVVRGNRGAIEDHKISKLFFPHGVGHLLGLQVHDVGGFFKDETGALAPPPEEHKFLRLNRKMEAGMVFTIEPGLYFIPMLLEPERGTDKGGFLDWDLIEALFPLGGIRIEDNILVTEDGPRNLTRG